ncbi:MAG TPA: hypothetical protein VM620_10500 [Hyphomicrobium sp.]|nr:hypothetical protein [Hyphomicrobium sp.]
MLFEFWNWLGGTLPQGASFLGALTGSSLGLVALLIGEMFNARLTRRRDDQLRKEKAAASRSALRATLSGISDILKRNSENLSSSKSQTAFYAPDIAHQVRVMPSLPRSSSSAIRMSFVR